MPVPSSNVVDVAPPPLRSPPEHVAGVAHGAPWSSLTRGERRQRPLQVCLECILPFLDAPDLLVASVVCRAWNVQVNSISLWQQLADGGATGPHHRHHHAAATTATTLTTTGTTAAMAGPVVSSPISLSYVNQQHQRPRGTSARNPPVPLSSATPRPRFALSHPSGLLQAPSPVQGGSASAAISPTLGLMEYKRLASQMSRRSKDALPRQGPTSSPVQSQPIDSLFASCNAREGKNAPNPTRSSARHEQLRGARPHPLAGGPLEGETAVLETEQRTSDSSGNGFHQPATLPPRPQLLNECGNTEVAGDDVNRRCEAAPSQPARGPSPEAAGDAPAPSAVSHSNRTTSAAAAAAGHRRESRTGRQRSSGLTRVAPAERPAVVARVEGTETTNEPEPEAAAERPVLTDSSSSHSEEHSSPALPGAPPRRTDTQDVVQRGMAVQESICRLAGSIKQDKEKLGTQHIHIRELFQRVSAHTQERHRVRSAASYLRAIEVFEETVAMVFLREFFGPAAPLGGTAAAGDAPPAACALEGAGGAARASPRVVSFVQLELLMLSRCHYGSVAHKQWTLFKQVLPIDDAYYDLYDESLRLQHPRDRTPVVTSGMKRLVLSESLQRAAPHDGEPCSAEVLKDGGGETDSISDSSADVYSDDSFSDGVEGSRLSGSPTRSQRATSASPSAPAPSAPAPSVRARGASERSPLLPVPQAAQGRPGGSPVTPPPPTDSGDRGKCHCSPTPVVKMCQRDRREWKACESSAPLGEPLPSRERMERLAVEVIRCRSEWTWASLLRFLAEAVAPA